MADKAKKHTGNMYISLRFSHDVHDDRAKAELAPSADPLQLTNSCWPRVACQLMSPPSCLLDQRDCAHHAGPHGETGDDHCDDDFDEAEVLANDVVSLFSPRPLEDSDGCSHRGNV